MDIGQLFDLTGKTAIVTGASKGIGKDIAKLLAGAGASLALIGRNQHELEEAAHEIELIGSKALPISLDLTRFSELPGMAQQVHDHFGSIDILINNAGINIPKPALEVTEHDWDGVHNINLKSAFFCSQAVGAYMVKSKKGKIIFISSQMALVGYYNRAAYCSNKGGVNQLTKALAIEWAPYQIQVNSIAPTFIETNFTEKMFADEEFKRDVLSRIPLGRLASTQDLFGAVLYLSSASSNMVTGQTLGVDGGWTAW